MNRKAGRQDKREPIRDALRGRKEGLRSYFSLMDDSSALALDVIIPTAERDLDVLPYAVDGVRAYLRHPIGSIFVIGADSQPLRKVCNDKRCRFVDERSLVDIEPAAIALIVDGVDRSTWIYQQLLKWNADRIAEAPHFLVVDADTIMIRPQVLERNGRLILNYSDEYHRPYFEMYERLLKESVSCPVSFTSHQMLYDKLILRDLKERLQTIHSSGWEEAILRNLDRTQPSSFSDYDTYGQFAFTHYPMQVAVEYWFNLSLERTRNLQNVRLLALKYGRKFKTVSFHHYKE